MRRRFQLVLFDLDGTLVDSIHDIADALNLALAARGLAVHPWQAVVGMVGGGVGRLIARAAPAAPATPDDVRQSLAADFRARYAARLVRKTRPYAGIADVLRGAPDVRKAVLTNKPGALARILCAALGLAPYLETVLGEDDLPVRKPDPAGVERLRAAAGASREATLYVGDSLVDVETARAAGVPLCVVSWGYAEQAPLLAAKPEHYVHDAAALGRVVSSRL